MSYAGGGIVKDVKNKAVLCKPLTMTKATYCKPHMQSKPLQTGRSSIAPRTRVRYRHRLTRVRFSVSTEEDGLEGLVKEYVPVPIPVPVYVPVPMNLYAQATPTSVAIPVPVRASLSIIEIPRNAIERFNIIIVIFTADEMYVHYRSKV